MGGARWTVAETHTEGLVSRTSRPGERPLQKTHGTPDLSDSDVTKPGDKLKWLWRQWCSRCGDIS